MTHHQNNKYSNSTQYSGMMAENQLKNAIRLTLITSIRRHCQWGLLLTRQGSSLKTNALLLQILVSSQISLESNMKQSGGF